jgi:tRNA nucleotidyltransferase (CCA-adding enzyme)
MVKSGVLRELPQERIYEEIKKLFLHSHKPSIGFMLLKELSAFNYFTEFSALNEDEFNHITNALDKLKTYAHAMQEMDLLVLMFSLLTSKFSDDNRLSFLNKITNQKEIIKNVSKLSSVEFDLDKQTDYTIYKLATKINIQTYSLYLKSITNNKQNEITYLIQKAKELNVLTKMQAPLLRGKDILELGVKPSQEFSNLLHAAYEKQIKKEFISKTDALNWLKKEITPLK